MCWERNYDEHVCSDAAAFAIDNVLLLSPPQWHLGTATPPPKEACKSLHCFYIIFETLKSWHISHEVKKDTMAKSHEIFNTACDAPKKRSFSSLKYEHSLQHGWAGSTHHGPPFIPPSLTTALQSTTRVSCFQNTPATSCPRTFAWPASHSFVHAGSPLNIYRTCRLSLPALSLEHLFPLPPALTHVNITATS